MGEIKIPTAAVSNSGKGEFYVTAAAGSRQEVDSTSALHFACHFAVQPSWQTGDAAWDEFASFAQEALEQLRIGVSELVHRDVHAAAWHPAVIFTQGDEAFGRLRLHESVRGCGLANLAVQGAALEEVIEFHFLQTAWGTWAFFVTCGDVTRSRTALGLSLRAFKDDDFACHKIWGGEARLLFAKVKRLIAIVILRGRRFLFILLIVRVFGGIIQTEK